MKFLKDTSEALPSIGHPARRPIRFVAVGGFCAIFNLGLLYLLVEHFRLHYLVGNLTSFAVVVLIGHALNRGATFGTAGSYAPELGRFAGNASLHAVAGLAALALLVERFELHYLFAAVIVTTVFSITSFFVQGRYVFLSHDGRRPDAIIRRDRFAWRHHDGYMQEQLDRALVKALVSAGCANGARVIDIGCGAQPYRAAIEALGATYTPCDFGGGPHVELELGRPLQLPMGSFQIGLSAQVLEHVWNLEEYLERFRRHLTPEGRLVLSTHGVWLYHPHPTDFRRWTRSGLVEELETRGFKVSNVSSVLGPLAWSTQIRLMGYAFALRKLGLVGRAVETLLALTMNARMWLEDQLTPLEIRNDNACVYVVVCEIGRASNDGIASHAE